jgi:hypothetical protein
MELRYDSLRADRFSFENRHLILGYEKEHGQVPIWHVLCYVGAT